MVNDSIARNDRLGAALGLPNGAQIQVVALADVNGNLITTPPGASGSSSLSASPAASNILTYALTAQTAANVGDSFDTTYLTALAVDVAVTAFAGGTSPSVTFFVDRFGSDSNWYRLWTSSAINAPGTASISIGQFPTGTGTAAGVLTTLARFGWSFGGAPTSVTLRASVVGR